MGGAPELGRLEALKLLLEIVALAGGVSKARDGARREELPRSWGVVYALTLRDDCALARGGKVARCVRRRGAGGVAVLASQERMAPMS